MTRILHVCFPSSRIRSFVRGRTKHWFHRSIAPILWARQFVKVNEGIYSSRGWENPPPLPLELFWTRVRKKGDRFDHRFFLLFLFFLRGCLTVRRDKKRWVKDRLALLLAEESRFLVEDKDGEFFSPRDSSNCYRSLEVKKLEDCIN